MKAFQTTPQQEFKARDMLLECGVRAFVPTERRWRRTSHHTKSAKPMDAPIINGYVIADHMPAMRKAVIVRGSFTGGFITEDTWVDANKHVKRCVGSVGTDEMARLYEINGREVGRIIPPTPFRAGDVVEIIAGPFEGKTGKIEMMLGKRAIVSINVFRNCARVKLETSQLRRADSTSKVEK